MSARNKEIARHVALPCAAPAALIGLYLTPRDVFGCANRGLLALGVALAATIGAAAATRKGVAARRRGDAAEARWWIATALILLSPIALLIGPLG